MARTSSRIRAKSEAAIPGPPIPQPPQGVTYHIDKLPPEILTNVLQRVRNSRAKSEANDFSGILTVPHRWHEIAKPILCTNTVLTNTTLPLFLARITPTDINSIHSLTIIIQHSPAKKKQRKYRNGMVQLHGTRGVHLLLQMIFGDICADWQNGYQLWSAWPFSPSVCSSRILDAALKGGSKTRYYHPSLCRENHCVATRIHSLSISSLTFTYL